METKELIQALRADAEWAHANEWETPITLSDHLDAAADALAALLAEVERENPQPLTLGELREVSEQNEFCGAHIWIKDLESGWATVAITDETAEDGIIGVWCADANDVYCEKDYGVTWIAYRYKPKEVQA